MILSPRACGHAVRRAFGVARPCSALILAGLLCLFLSSTARAQWSYIGQLRIFAGNFPPAGWHDCDGALLDISQYSDLFSLIGTTYGGDGVTTFALPDLRGRAVIGAGQGTGLSTYVVGQTGGMENVTLTTNQLPQHSHTLNVSTSLGSTSIPTDAYPAAAPDGVGAYAVGGNVQMKANTIENTGGGQPHNNMKPYLAVRYIIALEGIYPSHP
jgi:microcystin-dependent protein